MINHLTSTYTFLLPDEVTPQEETLLFSLLSLKLNKFNYHRIYKNSIKIEILTVYKV